MAGVDAAVQTLLLGQHSDPFAASAATGETGVADVGCGLPVFVVSAQVR